jgi:hypothetical protein
MEKCGVRTRCMPLAIGRSLLCMQHREQIQESHPKLMREDQRRYMSGTIIRGTLKTPNSQLVTPISIKLQRPDGYD